MLSRVEIENKLNEYLQDLFEVPKEDITPDAKLFEDLDLDSIDAIDLLLNYKNLLVKKSHRKNSKRYALSMILLNECMHLFLNEIDDDGCA